jgi:GDPmannose 4,6-dehydratase
MTTALITGITGMVGSHLADLILQKTNWNIVGMVRWRSPLDNINHLIPAINAKDRISLQYADLNIR